VRVIRNRPKAALRYPGGKHTMAPWVISFFPEHEMYQEPFFGAGSILFSKPQAKIETVNDLNGRIVNFFRVLRERPEELVRYINLSPWARDEFVLSLQVSTDPLEEARRMFISTYMSMTGEARDSAFRTRASADEKACTNETSNVEWLYQIAARLKSVQIENIDALVFIPKYDREGCLIYADPPYDESTRGIKYQTDVHKVDNFHANLSEVLHACNGMVVLSGYRSDLYDELYEDWERHDKEYMVNSGGHKTESLWLSPKTVDALAKPKQASMMF
jgi:DNA adenine methylase